MSVPFGNLIPRPPKLLSRPLSPFGDKYNFRRPDQWSQLVNKTRLPSEPHWPVDDDPSKRPDHSRKPRSQYPYAPKNPAEVVPSKPLGATRYTGHKRTLWSA